MEKPICSFGKGLLEEGLNWISGGSEFKVNEIKYQAMGDDVCEHCIEKVPNDSKNLRDGHRIDVFHQACFIS